MILYLVLTTERHTSYPLPEIAEMAIEGGVDVIQFRHKGDYNAEVCALADRIRALCRDAGVLFIVNDRVDVALMLDADGVHLGLTDLPIPQARRLLGPNKIIGGTASTWSEAVQVVRHGANYVGFGHIYPTTCKIKPYPPRGVEALRDVCARTHVPVIAIGGITGVSAGEVCRAGAAGIAVMSAVTEAEDPRKQVMELKCTIDEVQHERENQRGSFLRRTQALCATDGSSRDA